MPDFMAILSKCIRLCACSLVLCSFCLFFRWGNMFQLLKVCLCQKKEQFQMKQSKARRKEDHWQSGEGGQIIEGGAVSGVGKWVMPMSRWHRLPLFVFLRNGTEKGAGWVPASGLWHRAVALGTRGGNIDSWGRGREMKFEGAKKSGVGWAGGERDGKSVKALIRSVHPRCLMSLWSCYWFTNATGHSVYHHTRSIHDRCCIQHCGETQVNIRQVVIKRVHATHSSMGENITAILHVHRLPRGKKWTEHKTIWSQWEAVIKIEQHWNIPP